MSWPPDASDLLVMRADAQAAELCLSFPESPVVFQARVNQMFSDADAWWRSPSIR